MAERPVYVPTTNVPYVRVYMIEFAWNAGQSATQKRKNIAALHDAFKMVIPESNVLEISSKSLEPLGVSLSAFNLMKYVPSLDEKVPVECVYQGGKAFAAGGPYTDLYQAKPKDAKRDSRLKTSGMLKTFYYECENIPLKPATAFYDWIYVNAIMENPDLAEEITKYDAFTDIEFNPNKSSNCQARAAALYIALHKLGKLDECKTFEGFLDAIR